MYRAINDRIIIKYDDSEKTCWVLDDDFPRRDRGVVLDVGDKVKSVQKGEHIIFHLFDEIALPEDGLAVVREKSVLAKIE